jgi:hypothetical protein
LTAFQFMNLGTRCAAQYCQPDTISLAKDET